MKLMDKLRHSLRTFLKIENISTNPIILQNLTDYETNCIINRVWSWGDKDAIEQTYKQLNTKSTKLNFWSATPSMGIVKRHTGIPGMIIKVITDIVISDMNAITVEDDRKFDWQEINKKINMEQILTDAVRETQIVGDGVFRISIDTSVSRYPILEYVPGDKVEIVKVRGVIKEIVIREPITYDHKTYTYEEIYGYGYINEHLYDDETEIPLGTIPSLANIKSARFDSSFMMAVPMMFRQSSRYAGRGASIFEGKPDNFDSLDEAWSQWMDAIRKGRSKEYIPEGLLPRDPKTGELLKPNDFDHSFIKIEDNMSEGAAAKIDLQQPQIPHESYLATYVTALDLCLQGIISPSTLGIDVKKLDNADAQREKEKATLYTRNKIVSVMQETVPKLIDVYFKTLDTLNKKELRDTKADITFGEYANPSFESQVETVSKAKQGGVMSTEAAVDELYGDTKDDEWKAAEVKRIKAEQGIAEVEELEID